MLSNFTANAITGTVFSSRHKLCHNFVLGGGGIFHRIAILNWVFIWLRTTAQSTMENQPPFDLHTNLSFSHFHSYYFLYAVCIYVVWPGNNSHSTLYISTKIL